MGTNETINVSEQHFRHLFENLPICICVVDLKSTPAAILEINQRMKMVYGYTAAELVGSLAACLVTKESSESLQKIIQQVQQGETVKIEIISQHHDGTSFPVRIIASLDPTNSDHMIIAADDISVEIQHRTETDIINAERLRIAHDIHDSVAQSLGGLRFKTAVWSQMAEMAPPEMRSALDELQSVLTSTIEDIHRAIFALRPMDLESLGFIPALNHLVAEFGDKNQILAQLEISGSHNSLPPNYELALFRILQEALNNINQHACASLVLICLILDELGGLRLSVKDNGLGFVPSSSGVNLYTGHLGLVQMRERILNLGGTLDIKSAPGRGTELLIFLPPPSKGSKDVSD
jgi:PAS domain S-box-containing protein